MLTKEQCLSEELNPQSSAIDLDNPHLRDAVYYAMDLYARAYLKDYLMNNDDCTEILAEYLVQDHLQSINQKL